MSLLYIFSIGIAVFLSTLGGGLFALRFQDKLHLMLGFSAGAILSVTFFDLLPESIGLAKDQFTISTILSVTACGFMGYMILDRVLVMINSEHTGTLGAISLSAHSLLDGFVIGMAFHISFSLGNILALAVLVHDFSDGINTVNVIMLADNRRNKRAFKWLVLDAVSPILGIFISYFFHLQKEKLGIILALFAGFFLYIGASDFLPESQHRHPKLLTTLMTILGILIIYAAIKFAH
ncbi:MAG TPA: ZIP family metal transporter [Chitinophagaceae bacterium]|nr:ZIP family metal transporter [Chitinophagaceae bacterium]